MSSGAKKVYFGLFIKKGTVLIGKWHPADLSDRTTVQPAETQDEIYTWFYDKILSQKDADKGNIFSGIIRRDAKSFPNIIVSPRGGHGATCLKIAFAERDLQFNNDQLSAIGGKKDGNIIHIDADSEYKLEYTLSFGSGPDGIHALVFSGNHIINEVPSKSDKDKKVTKTEKEDSDHEEESHSEDANQQDEKDVSSEKDSDGSESEKDEAEQPADTKTKENSSDDSSEVIPKEAKFPKSKDSDKQSAKDSDKTNSKTKSKVTVSESDDSEGEKLEQSDQSDKKSEESKDESDSSISSDSEDLIAKHKSKVAKSKKDKKPKVSSPPPKRGVYGDSKSSKDSKNKKETGVKVRKHGRSHSGKSKK